MNEANLGKDEHGRELLWKALDETSFKEIRWGIIELLKDEKRK